MATVVVVMYTPFKILFAEYEAAVARMLRLLGDIASYTLEAPAAVSVLAESVAQSVETSPVRDPLDMRDVAAITSRLLEGICIDLAACVSVADLKLMREAFERHERAREAIDREIRLRCSDPVVGPINYECQNTGRN